MNDASMEVEPREPSTLVHAGTPEDTRPPRGRLSLAREQLRAAARVIESELGKAQARARALNAENRSIGG